MKVSREFFRFFCVGAFAAILNWVSRIAFSLVLPLSAAIVAAYLLAMVVAYVLNRAFVFAPTERGVRSELCRFALVNLVALAQVWAVTLLLVNHVFPSLHYAWHAEAVAHAIGIASPVITSYFGHRYYSFAQGDRRNG